LCENIHCGPWEGGVRSFPALLIRLAIEIRGLGLFFSSSLLAVRLYGWNPDSYHIIPERTHLVLPLLGLLLQLCFYKAASASAHLFVNPSFYTPAFTRLLQLQRLQSCCCTSTLRLLLHICSSAVRWRICFLLKHLLPSSQIRVCLFFCQIRS
jgi:hypothetical protein